MSARYEVIESTQHRFVSRDGNVRILAHSDRNDGLILWGGDDNGHFTGGAILRASDFEALIAFCNGLREAQNAVTEE